ncbi:MAG TPA: class I tRNA ligase family protein, partial [Chloroflexota bacterium]|nr:class I tRNA ligase family protein [Chloroflexota bacterium]
ALLTAVDAGFDTAAALYDACKFRAVVQENLRLSSLVNQYLEETSPWTTAKTDLAAAGRALYTALQAINGLKMLWSPILPFTSQQIHTLLGEEGQLFGEQVTQTYQEKTRSHVGLTYVGGTAVGQWSRNDIPVGRPLPKPQPLFKKLDPTVAQEELQRLGY